MEHRSAPWLRFYGDIPHHLEYPDCTMYQLVAQTAGTYPNRPAYAFMGVRTDFKTFHQRILETASAFAAMGKQQIGIFSLETIEKEKRKETEEDL